MADGSTLSPVVAARPDPLTAPERVVVAALSHLCLAWAFETQRRDLLDLVKPLLPKLRSDTQFNDLARAAIRMCEATTTIERSFAVADCQSALTPILRRDMMAALKHLPV